MIFLLLIFYPVLEIVSTARFVVEYGWMNFLLLAAGTLAVGRIGWRYSQLRLQAQLVNFNPADRHSVSRILQPALGIMGSVLLFLPGVMGDVLGFLLAFPPTGFLIARMLEGFFVSKIQAGQWRVGTNGFIFQAQSRARDVSNPNVIDVEARPILDVQEISGPEKK